VIAVDVAERVRDLVRETCDAFEIRIVKGVVSKEHVHILVSCPPSMALSEIMRRIKGRTAANLSE
jgi:putative transposase